MKNCILLENGFLEVERETAIAAFVAQHNNRRDHGSIGNLTPANICFGRGEMIVVKRRCIKLQTIQNRRLRLQRQGHTRKPMRPRLPRQNQRS